MSELNFVVHAISQTREITHGGRTYLVAPVIALKAGVLNGVLVEAEEFSKYAASWAGRPVPLGHPQANGQYISANSPDVWEAYVPGHFWNVEVDDDALKGEIWIDLEKAERLGDKAMRVVSRLRLGQPVEVSTGYFADTEPTPGVWNGKPYTGIARHIRPDHLALLPDEVGACSWADGCGAPRVNREGGMEEQPEAQAEQETGLFERFLGWLGQRRAQEVIVQQEQAMTKCDLIAALTANQQCKFSKEKLETWEEADLTALQESLGSAAASPPPDLAAAAIPAASPALPAELTQFAEMIRGLGGVDKLAAALGGLTANAETERADLIAGIMANAATTWSEEELRTFSTENLRKLHTAFLPRDYSGNGGAMHHQKPGETLLAMPKIDWATGALKEN